MCIRDRAGYDEDEVFEMDRSELLSTYAEFLLLPPIPESLEKVEGGVVPPTAGVSVEELELKRQELELKKQKEERLQREEERRKQEFEFQKERQEKEEVRRDRENEIREIELQRQRAKDEAERKRQESMAGQTRFYGEALKHSLPKMNFRHILLL